VALDIRGCFIGEDPAYLKAVRDVLGCKEVTAPDKLMEFHIQAAHEIRVTTPADLETWMGEDPDLLPAMERWAMREFPDQWLLASSPDAGGQGPQPPLPISTRQAEAFFDLFLDTHRVLPVCHAANFNDDIPDRVRLYYITGDDEAKRRWLMSLWGEDLNGRTARLLRAWTSGQGASTPGQVPLPGERSPSLPAISDVGKLLFVCSEPEYMQHIRSTSDPVAG
jgi:hypothetical protein